MLAPSQAKVLFTHAGADVAHVRIIATGDRIFGRRITGVEHHLLGVSGGGYLGNRATLSAGGPASDHMVKELWYPKPGSRARLRDAFQLRPDAAVPSSLPAVRQNLVHSIKRSLDGIADSAKPLTGLTKRGDGWADQEQIVGPRRFAIQLHGTDGKPIAFYETNKITPEWRELHDAARGWLEGVEQAMPSTGGPWTNASISRPFLQGSPR